MDNTLQSGDYSSSFNTFVYDQIPQGAYCLDVGCWTGNLGAALINNKNCIVDGIDVEEAKLGIAKTRGYTTTYNINLNSEHVNLDGVTSKYDVIIYADILEHLINPVHVLNMLKRNLKPTGYILVSLPNVAFILNRLLLLMGKWEYKDFGTLDKTHLKFYTLHSAKKLLSSAGFKTYKTIPYNQFGILKRLHPLERLLPTLIAYQIMYLAVVDGHS